MEKTELLALEDNSHLSVRELQAQPGPLGAAAKERLGIRARQTAIDLLGVSERLQTVVSEIALPVGESPERAIGAAVVFALRERIRTTPLATDPDVKKELDEAERKLHDGKADGSAIADPSFAQALGLDVPVALHPDFAKDVAAGKLWKLSAAAGLPDPVAKVLADEIGDVAHLRDDRLTKLVTENKLNEDQARAVGKAASLFHVLDARPELLQSAGGAGADPKQLVARRPQEWATAIVDSKVTPPAGLTPDAYGELLSRKVAALYPAQALVARLGQPDVATALRDVTALEPLRRANRGVNVMAARDVDALRTDGIAAADLEQLRKRFDSVGRLRDRYPGMKLAEVLGDANRTEAQRAAEVTRRIDMVTQFLTRKPDALELDLTPGSAGLAQLPFDPAASAADKAGVLSTVRTWQRMRAVTSEIPDADALVQAGFHSAFAMATERPEVLAARTGIDPTRLERHRAKAVAIATGLSAHVGSVVDLLRGGFNDLAVGNLDPAVLGWLKQLPGFDELFGGQACCRCTHCQSILGPAAYLVDLMVFVDEHVTRAYFGGQTNHPLKLARRRPDLWTLELTCENTNRPIPYLTVINEILENAAATDTGFAGPLGDRSAVEAQVYQQTLVDRVDSFGQPFHLPLAELTTYLTHFATTLADLGEAGLAGPDALARLRLGLPPRDHQLITQPNDALAFLSRIYGTTFVEAGGVVAPFDAQLLLQPMGVKRGDLSELIATRFVTAGGAVPIRVVSAKRSADSVQNDVERVTASTRAALDRMHRFVRLWRATGWRIGELDLALGQIEEAGLGSGLDATVVREIARIERLRARLGVSVEEVLALCTPLPRRPVLAAPPEQPLGDDPAAFPPPPSPLAHLTISLFDRLFNPPGVAGAAWPQDATLFLHPALARVAPAAPDPNLHRLQAGTGASEDDLYQLALGLALPLGLDLDAAGDASRRFGLSHANLTVLYRHAQLARLLRVTVNELFALCALAPEVPLGQVTGPGDLEALLRFHAWWKTSRWSVADLVEMAAPGLPAVLVSAAPVAGTAALQSVTCAVTVGGETRPPETVTFAANAGLDAVVADWNAKATGTVAYRSGARGAPTPTGTFLALRARGPGGADARLAVTADANGIFTSAPPRSASGRAVTLPTPVAAGTTPADVAAQIVSGVADSRSLLFTDTLFATLPPTPPTAVSRAAVAGSAGGETLTYVGSQHGQAAAPETVTLAANASLDAVVANWNAQTRSVRAFRSDATGTPSPTGDRLAIQLAGAPGSDSTLALTTDSAMLFTPAVPRAWRGAEVTADQSRAIVTANAGMFEPADARGNLRLRAGWDPSAPLVLPAGIDPALAPRLQFLLADHHSRRLLLAALPAAVALSPDRVAILLRLLGVNLASPDWFRELRGDVAPPTRIAGLVASLRRLARLFAQEAVFDEARLAFIAGQAAAFGISRFDRLDAAALRRVETFRSLLAPFAGGTQRPPDLEACVRAFTSATKFATAPDADLARALGCDVALLRSLADNVGIASTPFEALDQLRAAVERLRPLGIGGGVLQQIASAAYTDLAQASAAVQAAFRAKYNDEKEYAKTVGPFRDALLSRRRDGLMGYLLHGSSYGFRKPNDLYDYYLLDVQLEGCARTSRVAAAIDSLQLYVQRCLMNLEESPAGAPAPVHVLPGSIPADEWDWRKNYRVWEANRKIFLYPENWIEPELRDDKTPLFRALEDDLLSKQITEETILEAYGRYLRGFDELSHLAIAGSYHEKDEATQRDALHLFGCTADDPPIYYYRRVENAETGVSNEARATHWGAWQKIDVQIPVRRVSPIVYQGQLFAFWIRYTTKSLSQLQNGNSIFTGYQHRVFVEFTRRRLDGSWTAPQQLRLAEKPFDVRGDGVVLDPIVPKKVTQQPILWFNIPIYQDFQPLYDSRVHEVPKDDYTLRGFMWDQIFAAAGDVISLRGADFQLWSPVDLYRLKIGPRYDYDPTTPEVPWLNPAIFIIIWLLTGGQFDLTKLLPPRMIWSREENDRRTLHSTNPILPCFDTYTYAALLLDEARIRHYTRPPHALVTKPRWPRVITDYLLARLQQHRIGSMPATSLFDVVNGSVGDVVLQSSGDAFYLQQGARRDGRYHLRRLGASVSSDIADVLYRRGLDALLATSTQLALREHATGLALVPAEVADASGTGTLDFRGAMGVYLREIFFHVPFLIANYFNSQGRYEESHRWYGHIFDPTSSETVAVDPGLPPEEKRRRALDRVWRYREFRGLGVDSLRAQLTDPGAIEAYKRDPFNPHAIARLRLGAYQKAIVRKVVDNLLDWGDHLFALAFAQLNPEHLREATQKYVMAQEILGERPARLGDCGEGTLQPKTFPAIQQARATSSEFLMEMESIIAVRELRALQAPPLTVRWLEVTPERAAFETARLYAEVAPPALVALRQSLAATAQPTAPAGGRPGTGIGPIGPAGGRPGTGIGPIAPTAPAAAPWLAPEAVPAVVAARRAVAQPNEERITVLRAAVTPAIKQAAAKVTGTDVALASRADRQELTAAALATPTSRLKKAWAPGFGLGFVRQINPIFCVPANDLLLSHWDRVEDRLYKLRHCMDIEGVVRQLPLFAPAIDPGLLVRARAAGLTLEDILSAVGGDLPPYRFAYLVEKAKAFAATVQGLGGALLSALEKRDAEELVRLRNLHQRNFLAMGKELRRGELKSAEQSTQIAERRQEAAQYRRDYYAGLISSGLTGAEITQEAARITATVLKGAASLTDTMAGIAHLLPEVGSPFAMKYGGLELGMSASSWSQVANRIAEVAETTATISGIVAGYDRRNQGWEHQRQLADRDVKMADKELLIAQIRQDMAQRQLDIHDKTQQQQDEVMEFYDQKFSNLGLYTYLSRSLQQLHRQAYDNALALARLAERAYRFERPGDDSIFVGGEWDGSRAGLLAGERLMLALQRMERRFIETNKPNEEINQSFSLSQLNPAALITLRETGSCEFSLPELAFDLFYPGQYRREIRAARLTLPCITGPYTNVSAQLTLLHSYLRREPKLGAANLLEVPAGQSSSVSTSTAQGDGGRFELSFRDERCMPFERAGAVSSWRLELPGNFRPFDYQTIADVIVNLSYTALNDGVLRQQVESRNAAVEGSLLATLSATPLTRVFSLRQEFSGAFNRLTQAPAGTPVTIEVTDRHLPLFLRGRTPVVTAAQLVLALEKRNPVGAASFTVNGVAAAGFPAPTDPPDPADALGGLPAKSLAGAFAAGLKGQHTIVATDPGALGPPAAPGAPLFAADKLRDVLLLVDYRL